MNNNFGFTPGPWIKSEKYIDDNNVIDKDGFTVCEISYVQINENTPDNKHWSASQEYHREVSSEQTEANARLIAAAPEMLMALIEMLRTECGECENSHEGFTCSKKCCYNDFKGILEKATGKKWIEING